MYDRVKRVIDVVAAGIALVIGSPLILAAAVALRLLGIRPPLFREERIGRHQTTFHIIKLRTMTDARDKFGQLLPDADRLNPAARWLRAFGIDELPELVNVLRGEMSLVGPRPLPVRYRDRYSESERHRHAVRPGITGWAQVHAGHAADWPTRLEMDVWYVKHRSLGLDAKIVLQTIALFLNPRRVARLRNPHMPELRDPGAEVEKGRK